MRVTRELPATSKAELVVKLVKLAETRGVNYLTSLDHIEIDTTLDSKEGNIYDIFFTLNLGSDVRVKCHSSFQPKTKTVYDIYCYGENLSEYTEEEPLIYNRLVTLLKRYERQFAAA